MSHLAAVPQALAAAAEDLQRIGADLDEANSTAAVATTGIAGPAADQVSSAVASVFSGHAQGYQALGAQLSAVQQQFVQALTAGAQSYAAAEAENSALLQTSAGDPPACPGTGATVRANCGDRQPARGSGPDSGRRTRARPSDPTCRGGRWGRR